MAKLGVLFIGGTGVISSACSRVAVGTGGLGLDVGEVGSVVEELAVRATAALAVRDGSRSITVDQHAQRLAREAVFLLVFGSRPGIKSALLQRLGASAG